MRDVKRGLVEMVAVDRQVRQKNESVFENASRLERQIDQAVNRGRKVLYLMALKRRCAAVLRLQSSRAPERFRLRHGKSTKDPIRRESVMGMLSRMSTIVKSKMNRILDNAEDPRETLDYSYEKQLEMLRNVKRGVVEMVAAKRQIVQQADKVRDNIARLERQAEQALDAGREDLALMALERKNTAAMELQGLDEQIAGMEVELGKTDPGGGSTVGQGGCLPQQEGGHQSPVHRRPGPGAHRLGPIRHLRRDGRRGPCGRAG